MRLPRSRFSLPSFGSVLHGEPSKSSAQTLNSCPETKTLPSMGQCFVRLRVPSCRRSAPEPMKSSGISFRAAACNSLGVDMDLSYTDEQTLLRSSARRLLERHSPLDKVRTLRDTSTCFDPELWAMVTRLGWAGSVDESGVVSVVPNEDAVILFEEVGRSLAPLPLASSLLAAYVLDELANDRQRLTHLPSLCSGSGLYVLCSCVEVDASTLLAKPVGDELHLSGAASLVRDGTVADEILCLCRDDSGSIAAAIVSAKSPGLTMVPQFTAGYLREARFDFANVVVDPARILSMPSGAHLSRLATLRTTYEAAEVAGACDRVIEFSADHVRSRRQFNRPIGAFQAVQHRLADSLIDLDSLRWLARRGASAIDLGLPEAQLISFALALLLSEAPVNVVRAAHQVHGGVGFIRDHPLHLYFGRITAASLSQRPFRARTEDLARLLLNSKEQIK